MLLQQPQSVTLLAMVVSTLVIPGGRRRSRRQSLWPASGRSGNEESERQGQ